MCKRWLTLNPRPWIDFERYEIRLHAGEHVVEKYRSIQREACHHSYALKNNTDLHRLTTNINIELMSLFSRLIIRKLLYGSFIKKDDVVAAVYELVSRSFWLGAQTLPCLKMPQDGCSEVIFFLGSCICKQHERRIVFLTRVKPWIALTRCHFL